MYKIRIFDKIAAAGIALLQKAGYEIQQSGDWGGSDGLLVRNSHIYTPNYHSLLTVARAGAGIDNISIDQATEDGVCVFNTPGQNARSVVELVLGAMFAVSRKMIEAVGYVQNLKPDDPDNPGSIFERAEAAKKYFAGFELAGKTLGIIGTGHIGTKLALAASALGMKVIFYEKNLTRKTRGVLGEHRIYLHRRERVIYDSDFLSLHVNGSPENHNLIGKQELKQMKKGAILLNFIREGICNDQAVRAAIEEGHLARYVTDYATNLLHGHPRIICLPHIGASTEESETRCAKTAAERVIQFLEYGEVQDSVNFPPLELPLKPGVRTRITVVNKNVPNVIADITRTIAGHGYNISDSRHPEANGIAYGVYDIKNQEAAALVPEIEKLPNVIRVRVIKF